LHINENTKMELSPNDKEQIAKACNTIAQYLGDSLLAIHLFGSAIEAEGLKPYSDIDLFVTVDTPVTKRKRKQLMCALLSNSASPKSDPFLRALEVTVVNYHDLNPWTYPPKREMQFGEWLRDDILSGVFEAGAKDIDLAIIIKKIRLSSIPIVGQKASKLFEPISDRDFTNALQRTLLIWNSELDWLGDERNIILTIARIWYSISTGLINSKDEAAIWLIDRIPTKYHLLVIKARHDYLIGDDAYFCPDYKETGDFIYYAKHAINQIVKK
jgi:streptomycin 3"-adenylyltransferase